jgi:hypothetical protein
VLKKLLVTILLAMMLIFGGCQTTSYAIIDLGLFVVTELIDWAVDKPSDPESLPQDAQETEPPPESDD